MNRETRTPLPKEAPAKNKNKPLVPPEKSTFQKIGEGLALTAGVLAAGSGAVSEIMQHRVTIARKGGKTPPIVARESPPEPKNKTINKPVQERPVTEPLIKKNTPQEQQEEEQGQEQEESRDGLKWKGENVAKLLLEIRNTRAALTYLQERLNNFDSKRAILNGHMHKFYMLQLQIEGLIAEIPDENPSSPARPDETPKETQLRLSNYLEYLNKQAAERKSPLRFLQDWLTQFREDYDQSIGESGKFSYYFFE